MPTIEAVRDMPARPQAPIDESVKIPESVKRAAKRAESYYTKKPGEADTPPVVPAAAEGAPAVPGEPPAPPVDPAPPVEPPAPPPPAAAAPAEPPEPEPGASASAEEWEHRYRSMKGRYDVAQQTIGSMQEQMQQMGDELVRMQQFLRAPAQADPSAPPATPLITDADREAYGPELIDLAKRAAQEATAPEISALKKRNLTLEQQAQQNAQRGVAQALDAAVPNWRAINASPRFVRWLSLRDIYSGGVRHQLLNMAYRAADAPRVVAFFEGFVADEAATGNSEPAPQPQPSVPPAPREAAVPLVTLAAPGRARPASGDSTVPADKPIFTRTQISTFYADVRKGAFTGREVEKSRLENEIFAAQREGRVRG